jgi:hypothetical protein
MAAVREHSPATMRAAWWSPGNIETMIEEKKRTSKNTMNMRQAVRHGAPLRRKITHRQARTSPRVIYGTDFITDPIRRPVFFGILERFRDPIFPQC